MFLSRVAHNVQRRNSEQLSVLGFINMRPGQIKSVLCHSCVALTAVQQESGYFLILCVSIDSYSAQD